MMRLNQQKFRMKLFAALRKIREFERFHLPFIKSLLDLDIVIEIGYAEELEKPLTPKPLYLLELGPISTVRRRLASLVKRGVVVSRPDPNDLRAKILTISSSHLKLIGKYGAMLSSISWAI